MPNKASPSVYFYSFSLLYDKKASHVLLKYSKILVLDIFSTST